MMNVESILNMVSDIRRSSAGNLTIGTMLDKLNQYDNNDKIKFLNGEFFNGNFGSYRGYYEDLCIGYDDKDQGFNTVKDLKDTLTKALDKGVMYGYKGGEFSINEDTLVWLADYSDLGDMVIDIIDVNGEALIITKEEEW